MMEIDNGSLKKDIEELNTLISNYEEITLNLFKELKDISSNWQDNNSVVFENKIYQEKNETERIIQSLKNKKEIYDTIYDKYIEIGQTIKWNGNDKEKIENQIDSLLEKIEIIISEFENIDTSFSYDEKPQIEEIKEKMKIIKKELSNIKEKIKMTMEKIENIETEVKAKIKELETIKIEDFDFNFS